MRFNDSRIHVRELAIWFFACLAMFGFSLPASALGKHSQAAARDIEKALAEATRLHESGDIDGAIRGYQAILATHPNRVDVRSNLGAAFSRLGRYEEAIDQYNRALAIDPNNFTIRFNLGLAYYKAALFLEAARELDRLLASAPPNLPQRPNAVLILADCQVRLGEYKPVIDRLTPLADSDPGNRAIAYLLGSALVGTGEVKKGQELIDRMFRGEDSAEGRLLLGSILLLADDAQAGIKE